MKSTFFILIFSLGLADLSAQVQITPVVLGSAGNFSTSASGISLSATVGEPMTTTLTGTNFILTQGFQQPSSTAGLIVQVASTDLSCNGANDGTATATILNGTFPFTFTWNTNPVQTTQTATNLLPGTYVVTVTDASGLSYNDSVTVQDNGQICGIHVYSGLTPNGDGKNDTWYIDYIEVFQPNTVSIFNRWGEKVWQGENYNNTSVVFEGLSSEGGILPDGTYYYVIEMSGQQQRGWLELTH